MEYHKINSLILFNFAMHYYLTETANKINNELKSIETLPTLPKAMTPKTNFLFADELALLSIHPRRAKAGSKHI